MRVDAYILKICSRAFLLLSRVISLTCMYVICPGWLVCVIFELIHLTWYFYIMNTSYTKERAKSYHSYQAIMYLERWYWSFGEVFMYHMRSWVYGPWTHERTFRKYSDELCVYYMKSLVENLVFSIIAQIICTQSQLIVNFPVIWVIALWLLSLLLELFYQFKRAPDITREKCRWKFTHTKLMEISNEQELYKYVNCTNKYMLEHIKDYGESEPKEL